MELSPKLPNMSVRRGYQIKKKKKKKKTLITLMLCNSAADANVNADDRGNQNSSVCTCELKRTLLNSKMYPGSDFHYGRVLTEFKPIQNLTTDQFLINFERLLCSKFNVEI